MGNLTGTQATTILRNLGWPARVPFSHQVRCFQSGYALSREPLNATGLVDRRTADALVTANHLRVTGMGTASQNFNFTEFACGCNGEYACDAIWVIRGLIVALERLRKEHYPKGLKVVSGSRCRGHNEDVGGKPASQHLHGGGCDIVPAVTVSQVAALGVFSGIGFSPSSKRVVHVDVRHLTGFNPTNSTPEEPAVFEDGK